MSVTLIDPLLVFKGQESRLFSLWDDLLVRFHARSGFVSAMLLEALAGSALTPVAPFSHVSLVTFAHDADCAAAFADEDVRRHINSLRDVCLISPGLFAPVREISSKLQGVALLQNNSHSLEAVAC
jgi:hypothetical protein